MKSQRFRKIVCWMTGMTLFFCLPFLHAMAEFYYVENEWNYVDGSMDISRGIPENATGVMDRIRRKGVLRVATEPYFAPQEFIDPEKSGMDQYAGADMELARMIASRMGVELEIVPMEYTQVLPALTDNLVDLTISAMAFTPRRAASYTMSKGYYFTESAATTAFVIRESDRELYTSVEDLYDKTLIVQSSSLQEALVAKHVRNYREFRRVSSVQTVYEAVRQGKADVGIVDLETAQTYIRNKHSIDYTVELLGGDNLIDRLSAAYIRNKYLNSGKSVRTENENMHRFKTFVRWAYRNDFISSTASKSLK